MPDVDLDELLDLIRGGWAHRFTGGPFLHLHADAVRLRSGGIAHVRILVHEIVAPEPLIDADPPEEPLCRLTRKTP